MPFKIVEVRENNRNRLITIPSAWENKNKLKWPREYWNKYIRNEFSTPEADWKQIRCIVKRLNIPSHEIAEYVVAELLNYTETENDENAYLQKISDKPLQESEQVKIIADEILCPKGTAVSGSVSANQNNTNQHQCCAITEQNLSIQNVLLSNQTKIMQQLNTITKVQNTILQKIASFSVKLGDAALQNNADTDSQVTEFLEVRNTGVFNFKPIVNVDQLNELEKQLTDGNFRQKLKNTFSVIRSEGKGTDCAYTLTDVLFAREFLCQCSWSGGSRGNDSKIAWKSYKNILSFFMEMIRCWDITYTMKENELFFKNILKNSLKRSMSKKLRASTSRIRAKCSKMQTANHETTDEDENTVFCENEQDNDKNTVEEKNMDVDEENTMDFIEEEEKNTDNETEAENITKEINVSNLRGPKENEADKDGTAIIEIKVEEHDVDEITQDSKKRINSNILKKSNPKMNIAKLSKMKVDKERRVKIKIISVDSEES